ncbi:MAG: DUF6371 domain-containing protein [Bacteroidales bacterium]|jgi:hypothetical protein|nr:DUF6371 domain-containing protein [Bacteroidales bacterium]
MEYKYKLEKYSSKSKHTCPSCGRAKCFTRYIDTESGQYINDNVGICDHKNSCGYHLPPKEFRAFNDLKDFKNFRPIQKKEKTLCEIDPYYLKLSLKCEIMSDFETFLRSKFTPEEVDMATERYFLSSNKDGHVVYWQIDNLSRIRTGKIMAYNPITGKRLKQPQQLNNSTTQHLTWVHAELKRQMLLDKDWQLSQCLFGLHLLNQFPDKRVNIVEGEKTAVIMSIFLPEELWMSTGGFDGLNKEKLMPLKGRQIRLFPDLGCYDGWLVKAEEIMRQSGLKIDVFKGLEEFDKDLGLKEGDDLADLYLSCKF